MLTVVIFSDLYANGENVKFNRKRHLREASLSVDDARTRGKHESVLNTADSLK